MTIVFPNTLHLVRVAIVVYFSCVIIVVRTVVVALILVGIGLVIIRFITTFVCLVAMEASSAVSTSASCSAAVASAACCWAALA